MSHYDIFFLPFFGLFLTLPRTQTIKVIDLSFFQWAVLKKLDYEHLFQPYTYSLLPFSWGGGAWNPPIGFKKTLKKAERKELKQLQNVKIEPTGNSVRNKKKIF